MYVAYGKLVERREVTELSTPGLGREWAIGALCGAVLYTVSAVVLMLLGIYKVQGFNPLLFLLPNLALAIKSGVFEELVFRGVLMRSVEDMFGSWVGILVSSLAFGLVHLLNPGATLGGAIYICIEAGLLLSAAYLVTRRLWICMGFHMAWNYFQSAVFFRRRLGRRQRSLPAEGHHRRTGAADRGLVRDGAFGGRAGGLHHGRRDPSAHRHPPGSPDATDVAALREGRVS